MKSMLITKFSFTLIAAFFIWNTQAASANTPCEKYKKINVECNKKYCSSNYKSEDPDVVKSPNGEINYTETCFQKKEIDPSCTEAIEQLGLRGGDSTCD